MNKHPGASGQLELQPHFEEPNSCKCLDGLRDSSPLGSWNFLSHTVSFVFLVSNEMTVLHFFAGFSQRSSKA